MNKFDYSKSKVGIDHSEVFFRGLATDFVSVADIKNNPDTRIITSYKNADGEITKISYNWQGDFYGENVTQWLPSKSYVYSANPDNGYALKIETSVADFPEVSDYIKSSYGSQAAAYNAIKAYNKAALSWWDKIEDSRTSRVEFTGQKKGEYGLFTFDETISAQFLSTENSVFSGNDYIIGSKYADKIFGGAGNDKIYAGLGKDILVFGGNRSDFKFNFSSFDKNTGHSGISLVGKWSSNNSGTDLFTGIDKIEFADRSVELHDFKFVIVRGQDGEDTTMSFFVDGKAKFTTSTAFYDDATPINDGTYDAVFRTNSDIKGSDGRYLPLVVELFSPEQNSKGAWTGSSSVAGRTAIELHAGASQQSSEGCIVANGFFPQIYNYLSNVGYGKQKAAGIEFLDTLTKVTVEVKGDVEQPTVNLTSGKSKGERIQKSDIVSDSKANDYRVDIRLFDDGNDDGITKKVVLYFTIDGSTATVNKDFKFSSNITYVGDRGALKNVYKATLDPGNDVESFSISILADKKAEKSENIIISIKDIDLFSNSGEKMYSTSKSSLGRLSETEKLLVGNDVFKLTIASDVEPATAHAISPIDATDWMVI